MMVEIQYTVQADLYYCLTFSRPSIMCAQRRLISDCVSVQSDQSLLLDAFWSAKDSRFLQAARNTMIRMRRYIGWSESLLGANVRWFILFITSWLKYAAKSTQTVRNLLFSQHITKTRLLKYIENYTTKN